MNPLKSSLVFGALLALVAAGGPGVAAFGASSPSPGKSARIAAEQVAAGAAGQALGLSSGEKLVVKDVITDTDGSRHVRYDRTFDGLRVVGGDLVSHRDKAGAVKDVSWNASHSATVASKTPKVTMASAKAAGANHARSKQRTTSANKGELVVYAGGATPKLAFDVLTEGIRADQTPSRLHTIVDAGTGATLESYDEIVNGTGQGIYVGTVDIDTTAGTPAGSPWSMLDEAGNITTDMKNTSSQATGTTFTSANDLWGTGKMIDPASAGVDAHYGAGQTFDYFATLGRIGVGARSRVHFGNNYVNAFWDGTQMTYGDGAGNANPLVSLDIAGHEMTHGVTESTARLVYFGDAGGLNEATSDIFGTAVEFYADNASDKPDYLIGEKVNIFGDGKTPLRYMDRPSKDGVSKDCWSSNLKRLDPHYSSGPLNHWFYLASEGSGAKTINGVLHNSSTCDGSILQGGIGVDKAKSRDKAAKIWYRTLSKYLTSRSTYAAAREGAIRSAKELYGAGSPECKGTAAAFSAITVKAGVAKC